MRVLITGAHGQVGCELKRRAPAAFDVLALGSTELDIRDAGRTSTVLADLQPQLIINAAAYTAVDRAESEPEKAWAINCQGVENLAKSVEPLGIPVFHISTDYVFAGDSARPYRETDPLNPLGVYGASKLGGEKVLQATCPRHLILRTSWVFGAHGNNFVKTMLRLGRERNEISVVADQRGGPTSAASIADALWSLALRYQSDTELQWGVYHFSGAPTCSWHEFALEILRLGKKHGLIQNMPVLRAITSAEYPTPAARPTSSALDCTKLRQTYNIGQPSWVDELGQVLLELA